MYKLFFGMFLLLITSNIITANASGPIFSVNKTLYTEGDLIIISGKVDYDPQIPFIILQVVTPDGSGLAHIANILPKNDGSFKTTLKAGGPTWPNDGVYTIKISYIENLERQINYKESTSTQQNTSQQNTSQQNTSQQNTSQQNTSQQNTSQQNTSQQNTSHSNIESYVAETYNENLKLRILGFPSLDTSPQYYIDRYNNEPDYKTWFDSQFPANTIYDVLGFSANVPEWIKTYAQNWATGRISDPEFMTGLEFMLANRIIVIPGFDYVSGDAISDIPSWFRNTAHWWSQDLISDQEFINTVKYLITENIISIK